MTAPAHAPAHDGQPALLGARDARGRLPLRPRRRAGARAPRRGPRSPPFFDVIHQDPVISQVKLIAEPWDLGQGGYQVGNFPVGWAEWNGKYRDTIRRYWQGDEGQVAELGLPPHRLERPLRDGRPPAVRERQLRHRPRRLHARRSRLLQRQAQRGERRGQPRRHRRQPLLELRRRGPDRRRRDHRAPRAADAELPRHPLPLPGHPDAAAAATRSGRTQRGNNNAYCQDTELSWFHWPPAATGRRLSSSPGGSSALRHGQPGLPPAHVLPGSADPGLGGEGPRLVPPRRQGDDRRGLAATARAAASGSGSPATPSRRWTTWASPSSATPS